MLLLKTHTWPVWNNRLNKWALLALNRAPWPLGLILPHELSARALGCYHGKGWPAALQQPHLTTPWQRSCKEAPGLFSHTWFLGQLKKKKRKLRFKMGAKHSWADICKAVFQAPAKMISHHYLQVSEGTSTFSVKQGSEVQAEKPKEIYPLYGEGQVSGKMLKGKECLSPFLLQEAARLHLNTSFTLHCPWLCGRDWPAVHLAWFSLFLAIHLYFDSQPPLRLVRYNHVTEFQSMSLLPTAAT